MAGDDPGFDLEPILSAIDAADVLIIRFVFFDKRLLLDLRPNEIDPPAIALLAQASGIEERFRTVKQARPRLPAPERIVSFQWPRHAAAMEGCGVWAKVVERVRAADPRGGERRCTEVMAAMQSEERRESMCAIRGGDRYETMWERENVQ